MLSPDSSQTSQTPVKKNVIHISGKMRFDASRIQNAEQRSGLTTETVARLLSLKNKIQSDQVANLFAAFALVAGFALLLAIAYPASFAFLSPAALKVAAFVAFFFARFNFLVAFYRVRRVMLLRRKISFFIPVYQLVSRAAVVGLLLYFTSVVGVVFVGVVLAATGLRAVSFLARTVLSDLKFDQAAFENELQTATDSIQDPVFRAIVNEPDQISEHVEFTSRFSGLETFASRVALSHLFALFVTRKPSSHSAFVTANLLAKAQSLALHAREHFPKQSNHVFSVVASALNIHVLNSIAQKVASSAETVLHRQLLAAGNMAWVRSLHLGSARPVLGTTRLYRALTSRVFEKEPTVQSSSQ